MTKHGKGNDSYQFNCTGGDLKHHVSALQVINSLSDEWIEDFIQHLETVYRCAFLSWIGKEHLDPAMWETKGAKNATKRFACDMSPIKVTDFKTRVVNNALENEVRELSRTMKAMSARINALEDDNKTLLTELKATREENELLRRLYEKRDNEPEKKNEDEDNDDKNENPIGQINQLRRSVKALSEENGILKRHLIEKSPTIANTNDSFAAVANIHKPVKSNRKFPTMYPAEVVSKGPTSRPNDPENIKVPAKKFDFSPMKLIYFEGCQRRVPAIYRQMFRDIGVDSKTIRDITFLAEDILQIITYESAIPAITEALEKLDPSVRRMVNFDPCRGASYAKYAEITDEQSKAAYFAMMSKSAERITKISETMKSMKRSAAFINKIVELKTTEYLPAIRKPRCFVLGDFIIASENRQDAKSMEIVSEEAQATEVTVVDVNDGQQS